MHKVHGVAQQDFAVQFLAAVGGEKIVQVQCERRVAQPFATAVTRWQADVAPGRVGSDVVQKQVELAADIGAVERDGIGRYRGDGDVAADRTDDVVVYESIVEQVPQYRGDRG